MPNPVTQFLTVIDSLGLYSSTRAAAERSTLKKGTGPEFRKYLVSQGSSADEIEATPGLDELLNRENLTLDELQTHLKDNEVTVAETYFPSSSRIFRDIKVEEPQVLGQQEYATMRANDFIREHHSSWYKWIADAEKLTARDSNFPGDTIYHHEAPKIPWEWLPSSREKEAYAAIFSDEMEQSNLRAFYTQADKIQKRLIAEGADDEFYSGIEVLKSMLDSPETHALNESLNNKAYTYFYNLYGPDAAPFYKSSLSLPRGIDKKYDKIEIIQDDLGWSLRTTLDPRFKEASGESYPALERVRWTSDDYAPEFLYTEDFHNAEAREALGSGWMTLDDDHAVPESFKHTTERNLKLDDFVRRLFGSDYMEGTVAPTRVGRLDDPFKESSNFIKSITKDRTGEPSYEAHALPGGQDYEAVQWSLPRSLHGDFNRSHPIGRGTGRIPNSFGHARFKIRIVGDRKVLFVEEIQSDWSQSARRTAKDLHSFGGSHTEGFKGYYTKQELDYLEDRKSSLRDKQRELMKLQASIIYDLPKPEGRSLETWLASKDRRMSLFPFMRKIESAFGGVEKTKVYPPLKEVHAKIDNLPNEDIDKIVQDSRYNQSRTGERVFANNIFEVERTLKGEPPIFDKDNLAESFGLNERDSLYLSNLLKSGVLSIKETIGDMVSLGATSPNVQNFYKSTNLSEDVLRDMWSRLSHDSTTVPFGELPAHNLHRRETLLKSGVPKQPFIQPDKFMQFALKRLLKIAVDEDVDGIAFSTGAMQRHTYPRIRPNNDGLFLPTDYPMDSITNPDVYNMLYRDWYRMDPSFSVSKFQEAHDTAVSHYTKKKLNRFPSFPEQRRLNVADDKGNLPDQGHYVHYDVVLPSNLYKILKRYLPKERSKEHFLHPLDIKESVPLSQSLKIELGSEGTWDIQDILNIQKDPERAPLHGLIATDGTPIGGDAEEIAKIITRFASSGEVYDHYPKVVVPYLKIDDEIKKAVQEFKRIGLVAGGLVRVKKASGRTIKTLFNLVVPKKEFSTNIEKRIGAEIRDQVDLDDSDVYDFVDLRSKVLMKEKVDRPYNDVINNPKRTMLYSPNELAAWKNSQDLIESSEKLRNTDRILKKILNQADALDTAEWRDKFENYWFQGRSPKSEDRLVFRNILRNLDIPNYVGIRQLSDQLPSRPSYSQRTVPLSREENLDEFLRDSVVKHKVYRTTSAGGEEEFDSMFVIPREIGPHFGTLGVANDLALSMQTMNIPKGGVGTSSRESIMEAFKQGEKKIEEAYPFIMEGYINVKNPLYIPLDFGSWSANDVIGQTTNSPLKFEKWIKDSEGTFDIEDIKFLESLQGNKFHLYLAQLSKLLNPKLDTEVFDTQAFDLSPGKWKKINDMLNADPNIFVAGFLERLSPEIKLRRWLQSKGFDSIQYRNEHERPFEGEPTDSFILFDPAQFKSSGASEFNPKDIRDTYAEGGEVRESFVSGKLVGKTLSKFKKSPKVTEEQAEFSALVKEGEDLLTGPCGTCYQDVSRAAIKPQETPTELKKLFENLGPIGKRDFYTTNDVKFVHGEAQFLSEETGQPVRSGHAWIEIRDADTDEWMAYDFERGLMKRDKYYSEGILGPGPTPTKEYSQEELMLEGLRNQHYGPYETSKRESFASGKLVQKLFKEFAKPKNLSQADSKLLAREIETGRSRLSELTEKRSDLVEASREAIRNKAGGSDTIPLYRSLHVREELRPEEVISTSLSPDVVMREQFGGQLFMSGDIRSTLVRYDVPIDRVRFYIPGLISKAQSSGKIRTRSGDMMDVEDVFKRGKNEEEVIADVSGIEPTTTMKFPNLGSENPYTIQHARDFREGKTTQDIIETLEKRSGFRWGPGQLETFTKGIKRLEEDLKAFTAPQATADFSSKTYYHASPSPDIERFERSGGRGPVYFTDDPSYTDHIVEGLTSPMGRYMDVGKETKTKDISPTVYPANIKTEDLFDYRKKEHMDLLTSEQQDKLYNPDALSKPWKLNILDTKEWEEILESHGFRGFYNRDALPSESIGLYHPDTDAKLKLQDDL